MGSENIKSTVLINDNYEIILFQLTIKLAATGLNVWLISQAPCHKLPSDIKPPDKEILQLITFMYLKDYSSLIKQLNGIHMWHRIPNVIMVAGFDKYCGLHIEDVNYNPLRTAFLCTCLLDSLQNCAKKTLKSFLLVACSNSKKEIILNRYKILREIYFQNFILDENLSNKEFIKKVLENFQIKDF